MPLFEFGCDCGGEFEMLLKKPQVSAECPLCKEQAPRKITAASIIVRNSRKAEGTITSPKELDKRVGEMSARREQSLENYKATQEKVKKELGTEQITKSGDKFIPMPEDQVNLRKRVTKIMKEGEPQNPNVTVINTKRK